MSIVAVSAQYSVAEGKDVMEILGTEDRKDYPQVFAQKTQIFMQSCAEHGQSTEYCECLHENGHGINGYHIFDTYVFQPDSELLALSEGAIWSVYPDIIRLRDKCGYPVRAVNENNK